MTRSRLADADGVVTLWVLLLVLALFTLGGLSIDLWHVLSQRRALVAVADAAAFAGASGLDTELFRAQGTVRLDPDRAEALAGRSVRRQADTAALTGWRVAADPQRVTVVVTGEIETFLLRLAGPGLDRLEVTVRAAAEPRPG